MSRHRRTFRDRDEPTPAELAAIDREWPLIEAELALLDAELRVLFAVGGPTALDWRRLRRAEQQVIRQATALPFPLVPPNREQAA